MLVTGGTFEFGDAFGDGEDDEKPLLKVTLKNFFLSQTEVTVGQYRTFCQATARIMPNEPPWGWQNEHPMVNVSWEDAVAFCDWAGYRLPTEVEWEYAAREGGRRVRFGNGQDVADSREINFNGTAPSKEGFSRTGEYRGRTVNVASFPANSLGLYDMSGNVWEWCKDWSALEYYQQNIKTNPGKQIMGEYRVLRGGSWASSPVNCRASNRSMVNAISRDNDTGFRVARDR